MVAIPHRARRKRSRVRSGARLGQAIARHLLHGAQLRQPLPPLGIGAIGVDHPRRHVVDRDEGRHRRTAGRQRLEDQRRVEPRQRRAADIVADVDAADAERRRLAHGVHREGLVLVPLQRERRDALGGEGARHVANRDLVLGQGKLHDARRFNQFIVGMTNSAPSLTPDGQREVTVLVLV